MNKQEKLWQSGFGTAYHERNQFEDRMDYWYDVLGQKVLTDAASILEPGAGKGENLDSIRNARKLYLDIEMNPDQLVGIEVNKTACETMQGHNLTAASGAFLDVPFNRQFKLVITRGFLIHVPAVALLPTLTKIYNASSKYICLSEYYSPVRREVKYQGHGSAMWLDDFAGVMLDTFKDLKLVSYGFKYNRDNGYDLTHFVLEK